MVAKHPCDDDTVKLSPADLRLVDAIVARMREHPPQCLLGLDQTTVMSLKEIADGYRAGKSKALGLILKLALLGLVLGMVTALANIDVRAVLKHVFGVGP